MKLSKSLIVLLVLWIVVAFSAFAGGQHQAAASGSAKQYVLKFGDVLAPQAPFNLAFKKWAKAVGEKTNGNLKIQVFPSSVLGVEEDIITQIAAGANIGWNTDSARLGMYVPDIAVMNGPYFVNNLKDVQKLTTLPAVKGWEKTLATKYDIKILSFEWVQGYRDVIANKPVHKPSDLRGVRLRTPKAPIWLDSIKAIGATPVAMNYGDLYSGIQTHAVDGAELTPTEAYNAKLYEVAKYFSETQHILLINFEIVSNKWFDSLPTAYQKILVNECNKAGLAVSQYYMNTSDPKALKEMAAKGVTIIPPSQIAMGAFKKAGDQAYQWLHLVNVRKMLYQELGKTQ